MKTKALYIIWPDFEMIDRCIEAGINTLIVANQHLTPEEDYKRIPHWGSYLDTIEILQRYRNNKKVRVLLCPLWSCWWEELPMWESFNNGLRYFKKTPCPTSEEFIKRRIKPAIDMCMRFNANLIFDVEPYSVKTDDEIIDIHSGKSGIDNVCKCKRCNEIATTAEKQQEICNSILKKETKGLSRGQLLSYNHWTFDRYDRVPEIFIEKTYPMGSYTKWSLWIKHLEILKWRLLNKYWYRKEAKYIGGVWVERFNEDELVDYIKFLDKRFDGVWLYPQTKFSRFSPYHVDELSNQPQPFYHEVADDIYFEKLSKVLSSI